MVSKKLWGAAPAERPPDPCIREGRIGQGPASSGVQINVCMGSHLWYSSNLFMIIVAPLFPHCTDIRVCTRRLLDSFA
jgi:hypothetical protein